MKEKLVGVGVTLLTYLIYTWVGSFETKAASEKKFGIIDSKLDRVICYLDKTKCLDYSKKQ